MGFSGGAKIAFDTDVKLLWAALEPAAPSRSQRLRLFNLAHAQQRAIEIASGSFAALGSGDLEVIEMGDSKVHTRQRIPARG